jgi:hypothetical protein
MLDYDVVLQCGENESIECFKNLQMKYFDKIINEGNFGTVE